MSRFTLLLLAALLLSAGCKREAVTPPAGEGAIPGAASDASATDPVVLEDVVERDPRYIIGISYPPVAREHPGLAALLKAYADAARADLETALHGLGDARPTAPYDLSLGFTTLVSTPEIVAIAANGSSYTGGAHGNPLVARFVWLPRQERRLTADILLADPGGWEPISAYVREQLFTSLSQRADMRALPPDERASLLRSAGSMIDEGTAPVASSFDQFEPVLGADGRIQALRFVFPPYQVGPYSDGVQAVEVPAAVLLPLVAAEYRRLFQGG
ncbi:MAG: DUF3298 and DUF4163 domain-containing protein [Pseudomonadota bacterium]|nr:DUF3298 and DUF4163 domain-containing protein [Pseudomonadota bacterium]